MEEWMKRFERYEENRRKTNKEYLNKLKQKIPKKEKTEMDYIYYRRDIGKYRVSFTKCKYRQSEIGRFFDNLKEAQEWRDKILKEQYG